MNPAEEEMVRVYNITPPVRNYLGALARSGDCC